MRSMSSQSFGRLLSQLRQRHRSGKVLVGMTARKIAERKFDWKIIVRQYLQEFEALRGESVN